MKIEMHTRVLVIEDNLPTQTLLRMFLKDNGISVTTASDGHQGLDKFLSLPPFDLVILDLRLPGMSGLEVGTAIRDSDKGKRVPLVVTSANTVSGCREELQNLKIDAYLAKPYILSELLEVMVSLLPNKTDRTIKQP